MKARIDSFLRNILYTPKPLPAGSHNAVIKLSDETPVRLHLRIEETGVGVLIINASTILHLNPTAAEFAYHLMYQTPVETALSEVGKRYRVSPEVARQDFSDFKARLESLLLAPDLDPETFLDMERVGMHETALSAPLRLDCAVTYQVSAGPSANAAPTDRAKRSLDTEEWKLVLEKAWKAGIPHIILTGGEPTLRPDLPEIISSAEGLGQVTGLITDGFRLSEKEYIKSILLAGLDHLMIILDPKEERSWEAIRDAVSEDIFLTVHLTLTGKNAAAVDQTLLKLQSMQVKSLSLSTDTKVLQAQLVTASQKAIELGFSMVWDLPAPYSALNPVSLELDSQGTPSDGSGSTWLYVEPDGDVLPAQGRNKVLGNFLQDSWEIIWSEAKLQQNA
jgi:hypothetical protein